MKKLICLLIMTLVFILGIGNAHALDVKQESLSVDSKNGKIKINADGIANLKVTPDIEFKKVGDSITYKLVLKNKDSKKYKIVSVTDDNTNKYIKTFYKSNNKLNTDNKKVYITLKYEKEFNGTILELKPIKVTIKLVDEDGKKQDIVIDNNGKANIPQTGDSIGKFIVLLVLSTAGITGGVIYVRNNKKYAKGLLVGILVVTLVPTMVYAVNKDVIFNIYTDYIKIAEKYTVTFDTAGGSSIGSQIVTSGEKATKPSNPTREGYNFVKWVDESENEYNFNTLVSSNITLKAIWEKKEYTVAFNSDGGTPVESQKVKYEELATKPTNPTKEGYNFVKWVDENGEEYDFNTLVSSNITLKAIWEKKEYRVNFDSDGGTPVESQKVKYEETATKPSNPSKIGHTFLRWLDELSNVFDFATKIVKDRFLKAEYKINEYTVTFNSDGGTPVESQTVKDGDKAVLPTAPTRINSELKYWMDSDDNEYSFNTPVTSDINLKAKWRLTRANLSVNGVEMNAKIKSLANNITISDGYNYKDTKIEVVKKATDAQYNAIKDTLTSDNKIANGNTSTYLADAYMWFDSETGVIYWYTEADKIYATGSLEKMFANIVNLADVNALAMLDVSGVTDMNRMFQNSKGLAILTPLSNWNTSNVKNMSFMFGQSQTASTEGMAITDLTPLSNWNVSNVIAMHQMFKNCNKIKSVDPLANWNVSGIKDSPEVGTDNKQFQQMFNWCTSLTDAKSLAGWDVSNATGFTNMFNNTPDLSTSDMPVFTVKPGTWSSVGTYTPY